MLIKEFRIKNFRKLKSCNLNLTNKQTILVGANNSGKTSAMTAIKCFLKDKSMSTLDFTITNWGEINKICDKWVKNRESTENNINLNDDLKNLRKYLPTLDVWLDVKDEELHYVANIIPSLDWEPGLLGIRLSFEPTNIENLYKNFKEEYEKSNILKQKDERLKIKPKNIKEFLENKIASYFKIKSFIIETKLYITSAEEFVEKYYENETEQYPFDELIKIDIIDANRGFTDANNESYGNGGLTEQAKSLFDKYLDPQKEPTEADIKALISIDDATKVFDENLNDSFKEIKNEINLIGYPGLTDPQIKMATKIDLSESLKHDSSVKLNVIGNNTEKEDYDSFLPEKYNGLGYQNLISMVLKLIRFRYDWMKDKKGLSNNNEIIQPIQLVLIEEPEAHLHAQVQKVFINKAYNILRNHEKLKDKDQYTTQMIVSTHSSHIALETEFSSLRYFKRCLMHDTMLPCCKIVDLSNIFGEDKATQKFVSRYIKLTHCDLFFADAIIIVEGSAERILMPKFIELAAKKLENNYITIIEIGGSHAHKFRPLIEALDVFTLIISDIDTIGDKNKSCLPQRNKNIKINNKTLKEWIPKENNYDKLIQLYDKDRTTKNSKIMICYQMPILYKNAEQQDLEYLPYTFEDSLIYSNLKIFEKLDTADGLTKKLIYAIKQLDSEQIYNEIKQIKKAEIAINLLYSDKIDNIIVPEYITEGLKFIESSLNNLHNPQKEIVNAK